GLQGQWRKGLFDRRILRRRARLGRLKQVVQTGKQYDFVISIASILQGLIDCFEIFPGWYLQILFAVDCQNWNMNLHQHRSRVIGEEEPKPGLGNLNRLSFSSRQLRGQLATSRSCSL